jgi:hypothetical protein
MIVCMPWLCVWSVGLFDRCSCVVDLMRRANKRIMNMELIYARKSEEYYSIAAYLFLPW